MVISNQNLTPIFGKRTEMKSLFIILMVVAAALLLIAAAGFTKTNQLHLHQDVFINKILNYQLFALVLALLLAAVVVKLRPDARQFLSLGKLNTIAEKESWLGINGKSTWRMNGIQLLFFISLATGIFMFIALKFTNSLSFFQWSFVPFIVLFSFTNALSEELIFRFTLVGGLNEHFPRWSILILSGILFGIPHYAGWPNGITGVLMAAVLGYVLSKATIETKGLSVALVIHIFQDLIIFTALFMMNVKR